MRRNAEPMIGIEEREPPLQHVVDLDADLAGRRSEVAPPAYIFAVTVERLEEHRIGQTYDQEPVEVRVARRIFQQGQSACAVDGQLDRANSRERLETVEVRVEQYSRVADNRDLLVLGADALLTQATSLLSRSPGWRSSLRALTSRPATPATWPTRRRRGRGPKDASEYPSSARVVPDPAGPKRSALARRAGHLRGRRFPLAVQNWK